RGKSGEEAGQQRFLLINELNKGNTLLTEQRREVSQLITKNKATIAEPESDVNYVFLYFVQHYLPIGAAGLIFAIIFLASWSSISAAVNALASSSLIDFHQVLLRRALSEKEQLRYGRLYTLLWGGFGILVACFATKMGSLIEAVNELG